MAGNAPGQPGNVVTLILVPGEPCGVELLGFGVLWSSGQSRRQDYGDGKGKALAGANANAGDQ